MRTNNSILTDEDIHSAKVQTGANAGLTAYRNAGQDLDGFLPNFQGV
jgi:hypothetical protein